MDLAFGSPGELRLDPGRLTEARNIIKKGLAKGLYPGAVYLIGRHGKILEPESFGLLAPDDLRTTSPDTIYDIASLTKPIATATSILILLQRGQLQLDDPASSFFPDYSSTQTSQITVRHLLTHTSGLDSWKDLYSGTRNPDQIVEQILALATKAKPGERYTYSCLGYILLGEIVRIVSNRALDQFCNDEIFGPLGMNDTVFNPPSGLIERIAATGNCPARKGILRGQVHDANAWAMGGVSGNAGLFSSALDLARFVNMLVNNGHNVLSPEIKRLCWTNLVDIKIGGHTAGWFIYPNEMQPLGHNMLKQAISHTGFTGTSIVVNGSRDLFVILLTNRVCRMDDGMEFRRFRREFHDTVAQAMLSC